MVYIVTTKSGNFIGVFSTKEKAKEYIKKINMFCYIEKAIIDNPKFKK